MVGVEIGEARLLRDEPAGDVGQADVAEEAGADEYSVASDEPNAALAIIPDNRLLDIGLARHDAAHPAEVEAAELRYIEEDAPPIDLVATRHVLAGDPAHSPRDVPEHLAAGGPTVGPAHLAAVSRRPDVGKCRLHAGVGDDASIRLATGRFDEVRVGDHADGAPGDPAEDLLARLLEGGTFHAAIPPRYLGDLFVRAHIDPAVSEPLVDQLRLLRGELRLEKSISPHDEGRGHTPMATALHQLDGGEAAAGDDSAVGRAQQVRYPDDVEERVEGDDAAEVLVGPRQHAPPGAHREQELGVRDVRLPLDLDGVRARVDARDGRVAAEVDGVLVVPGFRAPPGVLPLDAAQHDVVEGWPRIESTLLVGEDDDRRAIAAGADGLDGSNGGDSVADDEIRGHLTSPWVWRAGV